MAEESVKRDKKKFFEVFFSVLGYLLTLARSRKVVVSLLATLGTALGMFWQNLMKEINEPKKSEPAPCEKLLTCEDLEKICKKK